MLYFNIFLILVLNILNIINMFASEIFLTGYLKAMQIPRSALFQHFALLNFMGQTIGIVF